MSDPIAVTVSVDVDTTDPDPGVLALLLEHLARRGLASTWFVRPDVDPALVRRVVGGGDEVGALCLTPDELSPDLRDLDALEARAVGARVLDLFGPVGVVPRDVRYVSSPDVEDEFGTHARLRAPDPSVDLLTSPLVWLQSVQVGVGAALERHLRFELRLDPAHLGTETGVSAAVEALDLLHGLVRAGRAGAATLGEVAAALGTADTRDT